MSLIKKLAGETAIYGISSILGRVLHYVLLTIYLTRELSKYEFGIFTDVYAMAAFLLIIFTYRMETAFFRFASKEGQLQKTFSTAVISILGSTFILVSILLLFSNNIANLLSYPDKSRYVIYFAFIIGFDALSAIPFARLRLENRPIRFAVIKLLSIVANIALVLFFLEVCPWLIDKGFKWANGLYQESMRLDYVFISNLATSFIVLLLLFPFFLKTKLKFDSLLWNKMLRYAAPLIIVGIAGVINQSFAVPLQKYLLGDNVYENLETGGVYGAAAKLAILMNLFTFAFNYAAEPFFFNQAAKSDAKEIYAQVAQAFTMVASIVFLGILLYLDVIQLLLGKDFRGGLEIVPYLLLAYLFLGLYYNFSIWYKLTDRTIYGAYISVSAAVITLGLNFYLLPRVGFIGSAWAALASYVFMAMAGYWLGRKYFPVPYKMFNIFGYILLATSIYFISLQIKSWLPEAEVGTGSPNMWMMLGINTILMLGYLGGLYFFERKTLKSWM
jgi:O-antigen/teichoic acid export membrane protein